MQTPIALVILLIAVVCNAKTILWTNAGGNPLWNNAGNWDCSCLPTISDDVVIDLQAIPGNVQIGGVIAPALCNSLTIGGTSKFTQTLTITGALNIGAGGGALNSNGAIYIESSPDAPISNQGQFTSRGGVFSFATGSLTGSGSLVFPPNTLLNFTGPATKNIATTVQVIGSAISNSVKGTSLQISNNGKLVIDGTFKATSDLTVTSDNTSSFVVGKGQFLFSGASLSIQGTANLASWSLASGSSTTIINTVNSGSLSVASGATVTLIGAPTDKRTFNTVTGSGTFLNQGGVNTFSSLTASSLTASGGSAAISSASLQNFVLSGSTVSGGFITTASGSLTTGTLAGGVKLTATNSLTVSGVVNVNDDGTTINVAGKGDIGTNSQITLTAGSSFQIASGAQVTQTGDFKFVQGPTKPKSPTIINNGVWSGSANLAIFSIPVSGSGSFTLSSSATVSLTNVAFSAASVASQGKIQLSQGVFNVSKVTGSGSISGSPSSLVSTSFETGSFTLKSGSVSVTNGSIATLTVSGGSLVVEKTLTVGDFVFVAGTVAGPSTSAPAKITAKTTTVKGQTATLTNVQLTSSKINFACTGSCQFFTNNAVVSTA